VRRISICADRLSALIRKADVNRLLQLLPIGMRRLKVFVARGYFESVGNDQYN